MELQHIQNGQGGDGQPTRRTLTLTEQYGPSPYFKTFTTIHYTIEGDTFLDLAQGMNNVSLNTAGSIVRRTFDLAGEVGFLTDTDLVDGYEPINEDVHAELTDGILTLTQGRLTATITTLH